MDLTVRGDGGEQRHSCAIGRAYGCALRAFSAICQIKLPFLIFSKNVKNIISTI
jgi:hypothetical protein